MAFGAPGFGKTSAPLQKLVRRTVFRLFGWPSYLRRLQWQTIADFLALDRDLTILDLGAGPMQYSAELAKSSRNTVVAFDLRTFESAAWTRRNAVLATVGDGGALPFRDGVFDRILMSSVLHMVPDPAKLLSECHRVLAHNGHMVLSVPNHYWAIPLFFESPGLRLVPRLLGLPESLREFTELLNQRFHVAGKKGHYSRRELSDLLDGSQFDLVEHRFSPGSLGSFLWEMSVLAHLRLGNLPFHLLFASYPFVRAADRLSVPPSTGSEHVVLARPRR